MSYVYFIGEVDCGPIKIGYGVDPSARRLSLQIGNSRELLVLGVIEDRGRDSLERRLHHHFWESRIRGEWFERTPELVRFIEQNAVDWDELDPRKTLAEPLEPVALDPDRAASLTALQQRMLVALTAEVAP